MNRDEGPYFVDGPGFMGQDRTPGVKNFNSPPNLQPSLWCQWTPTSDGGGLEWDQGEKAYDMAEWLEYLIDHFLKPSAYASRGDVASQFKDFTFDHVVSGTVNAYGEAPDDFWRIVVKDNKVSTEDGSVTYG